MPRYGKDPVYDFAQIQVSDHEASALAVAGAVVGVVGVFALQFVLGPLAMVFGGIALRHGPGLDSTKHGLAISAAVLGLVGVLIFLIGLITSLVPA
jgi:hypothetical protein